MSKSFNQLAKSILVFFDLASQIYGTKSLHQLAKSILVYILDLAFIKYMMCLMKMNYDYTAPGIDLVY